MTRYSHNTIEIQAKALINPNIKNMFFQLLEEVRILREGLEHIRKDRAGDELEINPYKLVATAAIEEADEVGKVEEYE